MFYVLLLYVHSCFAIILMGKRERELAALLSLYSWCLVIVVWLFLSVPWVCLQFVTVILTYYFWVSFMRTAMALASLHICLVFVCLFVCLFCCFTSQVNSYGHCGMVSPPNHTFSWAGLNKRLTSNSCTYFRL